MGATASLSLQAASLISSVSGQRKDADRSVAAGDYEASVAHRQAQDAIARGAQAEGRYREGTRQLIGTQRANAAASGVDVGSGSAADIQSDTASLGEFDAMTIRNNAAREAWGYETQGAIAKQEAQNIADAKRAQATSTILTGGAQLFGAYQGNQPRFGRGNSSRSVPRGKSPYESDG